MNGARRNLWVVMLPLWQKKTRFFSVSLLFSSIPSFPPASQSASPTTRSTFLEDDDDGLGNGPDDPQAVVSRFVPIYGLRPPAATAGWQPKAAVAAAPPGRQRKLIAPLQMAPMLENSLMPVAKNVS